MSLLVLHIYLCIFDSWILTSVKLDSQFNTWEPIYAQNLYLKVMLPLLNSGKALLDRKIAWMNIRTILPG